MSLALVMAIVRVVPPGGGAMVARERSFFGVVRITESDGRRQMFHGTTVHGGQSLDSALRDVPGSYYHPDTPMGATLVRQGPGARIGVVGLGTGALAALTQPGQTLTSHEIDPLVVRMARRYFTYLEQARADVEVVMGDGRLTLARLPPSSYDLLVVDAFSSDTIPTHLLTVEALELYLSRVRDDALVLLHISNRALDLARVLRGYAAGRGRHVLVRSYKPDDRAEAEGATSSVVAALSPDPARLRRLADEEGWSPLEPDGKAVVWTDDHTNLLSAIR